MKMTTSLKDRFREVDRIPSPWDDASPTTHHAPAPSRARPFLMAASAAAAVLAVVVVLSVRDAGPAADASWLTGGGQMCVEQYSPETLTSRTYAFEGVITDVQGPTHPDSADPGDMTTMITFDVVRWYWGGSGAEASRRTYSTASSTGQLDASIGAELLVAGDDDFVWSCGFTQASTPQGRTEFEAAAVRRAG
ncbi:MAG TPA: hypothetical protein VE800_10215 [Actinomycetota bacterium]|nr:hypothetical protein [Actinomycetota bacterium]